jgi:outer membrane protein OmpA-like peptidoglycan-associated protein
MKPIYRCFLLGLLAGLTNIRSTRGQSDLTLYHFSAIGQANEINPAVLPLQKVFVELPVLNLRTMFAHNSFSWRDLHTLRNGSVYWDIDKAMSKIRKNQLLSLEHRTDWLRFGFRVGKNYFSANVSEVIRFDFAYPQEFVNLLYYGNAAYLGETVSLKRMGFQAAHYREMAVGFSRELTDRWSAGIRLKYLYGMENIRTAPTDLSIRTDATDYSLFLNTDYVVNTSLPENSDPGYDRFDTTSAQRRRYIRDYLWQQKNRGLGINAGVRYRMNDTWSFNLSVVDLGYIRWRSNVKNYTATKGTYEFSGIDLDRFINDSDATVQGVLDSLGQTFEPVETRKAYTTPLAGRIVLSAAYQLDPGTQLSLLVQGRSLYNRILPSATLGIQHQVTNSLWLTGTYSMFNGRFDNLGAGIAVNGGSFQFFALCDNLIGTIDPLSHHFAQVHAGFNLIWGRPEKMRDTDRDGVYDKTDRCPDLPGLRELAGCPDRDHDSIADPDDRCPGEAGSVRLKGCPDRDQDGIADIEDECPDAYGLFRFKGCPDSDNDGIRDQDDACPQTAGSEVFKGCPDTDGDSLPDPEDRCPLVKGPSVNQGCPVEEIAPQAKAPVKVTLAKEEQEILNTVFSNLEFETGKAVIRTSSFRSLDELVELLRKRSAYRLTIDGHTDATGPAALNDKLSLDRAISVKEYLTAKGIDASRITANGFGSRKPVASNKTAAGRQMNRRVEFTVFE